MLISPWEYAFVAGLATGAVFTLVALFLIALLYRLDHELFCADEIDFDFEKPKKKFTLISKKPEGVR